MKFLFTALFFFCYTPFLFSQTIDIATAPGYPANNSNTFSAGDGTVNISGNQFGLGSATVTNPAAWSFSSSKRRAAFLQVNNGVNLTSYNSGGEVILEKSMNFFEPSDNTMNVYQFDDGNIVLRDNVANFSFLNAKGNMAYSVSNSSGSTGGERESNLAANPFGNTVVLYNSVISYGNQTGSRARIVYGDQKSTVFFNSRDEEIKHVWVSDDGAFITILSSGSQGDNAAVFDRFGNELFGVSVDEDLIGASLHENASHLTIYSGSRVQVYEVPGGERLGSASSRSSIIYAEYDPENQTIIALGGNLSGMRIEDPEITAVSISQREIVRQDIPFSISTLDTDRLNISKNDSGYEISGLNRHLLVTISF